MATQNTLDDVQEILGIRGVSKAFAGTPALNDVTLSIAAGEIVVLLGPSGCGKTTLLRIIAGLERPDEGEIVWEGNDLAVVPIHRRGFSMVFQDYALFPHKNVAQNVIFGLRMHGWEPAASEIRLAEVLSLVGLKGFEERAVHELSGGEQQRVALARALAPSPRLLLLDEPLGALDRTLRERLMGELRTILKGTGNVPQGMTAIYVTHDQAEALALADRVVVMSAGQIEQIDTPSNVFRQPATPTVARFLGMENLLPGQLIENEPGSVHTALGELAYRTIPESVDDREVTVLVRPDAGRLAHAEEDGPNLRQGYLRDHSFRGRYQVATVEIKGIQLKLEFEQTVELPAVGKSLQLVLDPADIQILGGSPLPPLGG